MNPLAGLLSERLSKAQVIDGFDTEPWAVCGRLPQAVVFPGSEEQVAEIPRCPVRKGGAAPRGAEGVGCTEGSLRRASMYS